MSKTLVIVDLQNDFIRKDGKLAVPGAESIIPNVLRLIEQAKKENWTIITTADIHSEDDPEFKVWPPHCLGGTEGSGIVDEVSKALNKVVMEGHKYIALSKDTLSVFESNEDANEVFGRVCELDNETDSAMLYVCGVATEYCVKELVVGARKRAIPVSLIVDAIAGVDEIPGVPKTKGAVVAAAMKMGRNCAEPVYTDDIVKEG